MFTGKGNSISNYVSPIAQNETAKEEKEDAKNPPLTFALYDQNEQLVSFEDLRGKIIFLNFWATWCPPCVAELGHIQELSEQYKESKDVVILTTVLPGDRGVSKHDILDFIEENGYTMPVLFDDGTLFGYFGINSFPTTLMINRDGTPYGYAKGQLTKEMMEKLISQTLAIN